MHDQADGLVEIADTVGQETQQMECFRMARRHIQSQLIAAFRLRQLSGLMVALALIEEVAEGKRIGRVAALPLDCVLSASL